MKKLKQAIAVALTAALLLQAGPMQATAAEDAFQMAAPSAEENIPPEGFTEEITGQLDVLYEEEDQREASAKHFRLSDGSYVAASYPWAVHYEVEEGKWADIDNTLTVTSPKASGNILEKTAAASVYRAENGEEIKSFAAVLRPDETLFSLTNNQYGLGMAVLHPETAQMLITEKKVEEEPEEELESSALPSEDELGSSSSETPESVPEVSEGESSRPESENSEINSEADNAGSTTDQAKSQNSQINDEESLGSGLAEENTESFSSQLEEIQGSSETPESSLPSEPEESKEALESSLPSGPEESTEIPESSLPGEQEESMEVPESSLASELENTGSQVPPVEGSEETELSAMAERVTAEIENPVTSKVPNNSIDGITGNVPEASRISLEEQVKPKKISSTVTYKDVMPGVDLQYQSYGFNVKESIVINKKQKNYRYDFLLNFNGLTPVLQENGGVDLMNEEKEIIYQIPAPYMVDAKQKISYDAKYELVHTTEGYVLTVEANEEWIDAEDRTFPVMIDPTVILYGGDYQGSITATTLTSGTTNTGAGGEILYIGHDSYGRDIQSFVQFGKLPTLPSNCSVVNAVLGMYQHTYSAVGMNRLFLRAHEVTAVKPSQYGTAADWIRAMTWNTKPAFDANVSEAYARVNAGNQGSYVTWDISRVVSKWYANKTSNRILAMDAIGPNQFSSSSYAASAFWMNVGATPVFMIYYRNNVGLEGRYTYQTASVGRAGTAYVGDYTSQLTVANTLLSSYSEVMPFSLTAYYNSPYHGRYFTANNAVGIHTADYTTMNIGDGWKLNVQETVVKQTVKTNDVSTEYYIYTDADGTEHYFEIKPGQSSYQDDEGLGLTLSLSGTVHTLKDETNNRKEFTNGYLTKLIDRNGNTIYFLYNDNTAYSTSNPVNPSATVWKPKAGQSNRMTQIWQANDNGSAADVQVLICKFTYSGNYLSKVTDSQGREVSLQYTLPSSGMQKLSKIVFPDGYEAEYAYSAGAQLLTKLFDGEAQAGVEFGYQNQYDNWLVQNAKEFIASSINGTQSVGNAWHNWSPSLQQRQYRFYGQDHIAETEDDIVTHYTFDIAGRTVNVVNHNTDRSKVLGTSAAAYTKNTGTSKTNNRVTGAAASGITSGNRLNNSGLEQNPNSSYGWNVSTNISGGNAALRANVSEVTPAITPRTGGYLMKMYAPSGSSGTVSGQQTVYLEAGKTYVFSGYANSSGIQNFGADGGMSVSFQNTSGVTLAESNILNSATSAKIQSGWSRLEVSFTPDNSGDYRVSANVKNASTYAAFDDFQLEEVVLASAEMPEGKQGTASSANLLQMGGVELWNSSGPSITSVPVYWTYDTARAQPVRATGDDAGRGFIFQILGHPDAQRRASQTVVVNRPSDTTYMLSGWGKAMSVTDCAPITDLTNDNSTYQRFFGMIVKVLYSDTATPEYQYVSFDPQYDGWQYTSGFIVPKRAGKTVSSITVSLAYDHNVNTAWFDQISLTEEPAQTYTYDSNGKLKSVTKSSQSTDTYTYSGPDLTKFVSSAMGTFDYTYDSDHNMTKATNDGVNLTAQYDTAGNNTLAKLQKGTSGIYMQSSAAYTADKNHTASVTDVNNITTRYTYDNLNRLSSTITPYQGGTLTETQTYGAGSDRVTNKFSSGTYALSSTYENGQLTVTSRKSFAGSTTNWQRYLMPADSWGNITSVQVQSGKNAGSEADVAWEAPITLGDYEYAENNGPLTQMTYGNGDSIRYSYDVYGRGVLAEYRTGNLLDYTQVNTYDANGNVARSAVLDGAGNLIADYLYEYDSLGRLIRSGQSGDGVTELETQHQYDAQNRLCAQSWKVPGQIPIVLWDAYTYNNNNGTLHSMLLGTGRSISFGYDNLLRMQSETLEGVYQRRRNYTNAGTTNHETNQINYFNYLTADGTSMKLGYQYKYDAAGNIKEVYSRTGTNALALESSYEYDRLGQITKATDSRGTETYTYDTAGNLLSRALGGTGSTYTYGNSSWGDLLTAFKGQGIAYEGQTYSAASNTVSGTAVSGNPVSYYNGTRWAMDWKNGTQLSTASASGKNVSYIYDKDGLRTSKTVNGVTYEYAYAGGKLMWQGWSGNEIYFFYDNAGAPVALYYFPANGGERITGYYMTNQQGDIVRIENQYGTVIASYAYDAWGKPVSAAGSIADINPLRYRGYYYDTDTGFYYLQSRYYDPVVSRFISADSFASTGQGILGYNMFAYCNNDPVNYSDPSGDIAIVDDIIAIGLFFIATVVLAAIASSVVQFVQNITGSATSGSIAGSWNSASDIPKRDYAKEFEEQEKKIIASREKKSPILFPVNPMDFNPIGLERIPRVEMNQGKNGGIIHWVYPGTSVVIFEWNQDLNNTSHYHTMRPRDANHHNEGIHYLPGTPIPEPWRSMFFGG